MQTQPTTRVAIYARVSTEDQAERQTIQAQLDFLRKYCDLHQIPIAGEYVDDGISGTVPLAERPEGRRLLDDSDGGRFGVVLVYRLDRLGRSLKALIGAHDALDGTRIAIRSATEPFDTSTPIGKFLFQLLGSLAELERSTIQERMTMGRDRIAKAGKYTGGVVALGYEVGAAGTLVPSPRVVPQLGMTEADLVRDIFARVAGGSTLVREAQRLQALGVASVRRYGGDGAPTMTVKWSAGRLSDILHNPTYCGRGLIRSRHGTIERPTPALVDLALWDGVQAALTRNRKLSKKNAKRIYLLRGLIACGSCGQGFSGTTARSRTRDEFRYYRCNSLSGASRPDPASRCHAKAVDADWLEALVWDDIKHWARNPGDYLADAQRQLRERLATSAGAEDQRRRLIAQIADKETERERVLTMYRRGRITMDEADRQLDAIGQETATLRGLVESLRAQEALTSAAEAYLTDTAAALARLHERIDAIEAMPEGSEKAAEKREQIELLVREIFVDTETEGRRKRATVRVRYAYDPAARTSVVSATPGRG